MDSLVVLGRFFSCRFFGWRGGREFIGLFWEGGGGVLDMSFFWSLCSFVMDCSLVLFLDLFTFRPGFGLFRGHFLDVSGSGDGCGSERICFVDSLEWTWTWNVRVGCRLEDEWFV